MPDNVVVIEAAVNGATPRSAHPHVPRSPAEIAADALACVEAGASIVHNHHDEPMFRRGGHLRVGLEDRYDPDAPGNRGQVDGAVALVERLGRRPATPAEARSVLGVPGRT